MRLGYTLMTEQSGPRELVVHAAGGERAGFDFEVISDHFFPWLDDMGHSSYAWSVLGAVTQVTQRVELMTYVTCPIMRYHPAVVAQKAATVDLLSDGRFTLGIGAGENLNEHVVGQGWPPVNVRHEMLEEALTIINELFDGGYVNFAGDHYRVDSAKVWDLPQQPVPIGVAVSGKQSVETFARLAQHSRTPGSPTSRSCRSATRRSTTSWRWPPGSSSRRCAEVSRPGRRTRGPGAGVRRRGGRAPSRRGSRPSRRAHR